MTKKHFEAIARIVSKYIDPDAAAGYDDGVSAGASFVAEEMADYFEIINPNFNRAQFLTACGI